MKRIVLGLMLIPMMIVTQSLKAQSIAPTPSDYDLRLQKLQDELNQLELQSEKNESQMSKGQKSAITLVGGSLEQDFESNSSSWSILQGQTLNLKFAVAPMDGVTGTFDLMFWGKVAPDILHFSYLPTLASQNIFFLVKEAEINYDASILSFRAFTGVPHDSFYNSDDDFYYLFPAQQDIDTPFRVSGRVVPTGMEIKGEKDLDGLDIWAGYELNWGVSQEVFLKYKHDIAGMTLGVIDKITLQDINNNQQGVTYAPPVTVYNYTTAPQNIAEAFWKIPVQNVGVFDAVALYNAVNANQPYNYVKSVAPGTGTNGTNYQLYVGTTNNTGDAMGYQLKFTTRNVPFVDSIMLNGEYSGILAGDLERITGEVTEIPAPNWLVTFDFTAQQPLLGPNPLIYNGSPSNSIGTLVQPRSQFDPFRVTQDPISGINNRQMTKFSLSALYNTGNGWFFKYNPNVYDSYNINMDLDTNFSTGLIGTIFSYPTGTDLTSYVDQNGDLVFEAPGSLGQPATNGYLPFIHSVTMWKTEDIHWIVDLAGGYSTASLGQPAAIRSTTDLFQGTITTRIHNTSLALTYGQDVWGPESWDQQFGETIGRLWVATVTQKFGLSSVSLKYESWSNLPGDPYQYANINGSNLPIQELYATYMLNF